MLSRLAFAIGFLAANAIIWFTGFALFSRFAICIAVLPFAAIAMGAKNEADIPTSSPNTAAGLVDGGMSPICAGSLLSSRPNLLGLCL